MKDMWGLVPQPPKPEYRAEFIKVMKSEGNEWLRLRKSVTAEWFGDCINEDNGEWKWYSFEKGRHISWQQTMLLLAVEKSMGNNDKTVPRSITVASGHGIGKSSTCSWFILWFLFCFYDSQVPVTAPTSHQMHDVLWKEISIWIGRMPAEYSEIFEWSSDYVRVRYSPESWFARARTATKENTEAIAGVHADSVAILADEASGVPEQVFNAAEGSLTSGNVFVFLISNPTRITGYFYDSHHKDARNWQDFTFNGEESPLVDRDFINKKRERHGRISDEYKIRVLGIFPGEATMDGSGYLQLIPPARIQISASIREMFKIGRKVLGIDPAGEGKDTADFVLRNRFRAERIHSMVTSDPKSIAEAALTFMAEFNIDPNDVVCDSFGVGSDVGKEIALASGAKRYNIYTVLVGNRPIDEEGYNGRFFLRHDDEKGDKEEDMYLNLRALMYFRARSWIFKGGQIVDTGVDNSSFKNQLSLIKYKRILNGNRIQLMTKKEMLKLGIASPNTADAFALTFLRDLEVPVQSDEEIAAIKAEDDDVGDPHSLL